METLNKVVQKTLWCPKKAMRLRAISFGIACNVSLFIHVKHSSSKQWFSAQSYKLVAMIIAWEESY